MTEMTTMTIAVQSITAASETHAIRRLRRYLRMRWSLYIRADYAHSILDRELAAQTPFDDTSQWDFFLLRVRSRLGQKLRVEPELVEWAEVRSGAQCALEPRAICVCTRFQARCWNRLIEFSCCHCQFVRRHIPES